MPKHLTLDERNIIAQRLNEGFSFKAIANELGKNRTTVHYNLFQARNTDMLRKVRYAKRKKKKDYKVSSPDSQTGRAHRSSCHQCYT